MMRNWRKILALLLMLALLLPLAPAAMAEDGEDDARFAGRSWEEIIDEFLSEHNAAPRYLVSQDGRRFRLDFDCAHCQMLLRHA